MHSNKLLDCSRWLSRIHQGFHAPEVCKWPYQQHVIRWRLAARSLIHTWWLQCYHKCLIILIGSMQFKLFPKITSLTSNWRFLEFSWECSAPTQSPVCFNYNNLAGHWLRLILTLLQTFHLFRAVNRKVKPQLLKGFTQSQGWTFIFMSHSDDNTRGRKTKTDLFYTPNAHIIRFEADCDALFPNSIRSNIS